MYESQLTEPANKNVVKKVLIIDDHEVVRDGLKRILNSHTPDLTFGEASKGSEAIALVSEQDWDVVVLDISLAGRSGLEILKEIKQIRPRLRVLVLSMHSEEQYARRAFRAGAAGYITKDSQRSELITAVDKVAHGGRYVSPALAEELVIDLEKGTDRPTFEILSDREFEVMRLIASGKTVNEIADSLFLSESTVRTYRTRILEKLGLKSNAELIHYAIQNKLVD